MIVPKLTGKALTTFKAFRNTAGDTNNALTTTWAEFIALFKTLIPNYLAESLKIKNNYDKVPVWLCRQVRGHLQVSGGADPRQR
eukprot:2303978-Rhodomonas_salina.2